MVGERYTVMAGALVVDRGVTTKDAAKPVGNVAQVVVKGGSNARVMEWGADNCRPYYREALVADNNIVPALMQTRRAIILGRGLMAYRKVLENGEMRVEEVEMPPEIQAFLDRSQITKYLATAARNEVFHGAVATEFVRDRTGRVSRLKALECRQVRLEEQSRDGYSKRLFWKGVWGNYRRRTTTQIDRAAQALPLYHGGDFPRGNNFATFEVDDLLCLDEYYPVPFWEGSEEWISLANKIPQFHDNNLAHGFTMRWHIEIPKGYFLDATALERTPDGQEREDILKAATSAKATFMERLNETLQGLSNAGKTVVTEYDIDRSVGREYPGIKITPLAYDMKDEALLKLFDASNAANMSAQGVHPTLANIQTQGKLSSGSEIRNAYLMYVAIHTPMPRERLLRWVPIVRQMNGWPKDIHLGFRDMLITRLDEDKSGSKDTNQNPGE